MERERRSHRRDKTKYHALPIAGLGVSLLQVKNQYQGNIMADPANYARGVITGATGYDMGTGTWNFSEFGKFWSGPLAGYILEKAIKKLNGNKNFHITKEVVL